LVTHPLKPKCQEFNTVSPEKSERFEKRSCILDDFPYTEGVFGKQLKFNHT